MRLVLALLSSAAALRVAPHMVEVKASERKAAVMG